MRSRNQCFGAVAVAGVLALPGAGWGALARQTGAASTSLAVSDTSTSFIRSQQSLLDPDAGSLRITDVQIDVELRLEFPQGFGLTAEDLIESINVTGFSGNGFSFGPASETGLPFYARADNGSESRNVEFSPTDNQVLVVRDILVTGSGNLPVGRVDFAAVEVVYRDLSPLLEADDSVVYDNTLATYTLGPIPEFPPTTALAPGSAALEGPLTGDFIRAVTADGTNRVFAFDSSRIDSSSESLLVGTPVPEPASALAFLGSTWLAARRRR